MNVEILVYGGRTWCSQVCANLECEHNFTEGEHKAAIFWWGSEDYPLAKADLKTDECGFIGILSNE